MIKIDIVHHKGYTYKKVSIAQITVADIQHVAYATKHLKDIITGRDILIAGNTYMIISRKTGFTKKMRYIDESGYIRTTTKISQFTLIPPKYKKKVLQRIFLQKGLN